MSIHHHRRVPELEEGVSRVVSDGFFPTSPAATLREAIFSEILAGVMGAKPEIGSLEEFYDIVETEGPFEAGSQLTHAIDIYESTYTTTGERGARGKKAKRYAVPFHPTIAECIRPEETRNWGRWYQMLMTSDDGEFNSELHEDFVNRLEEQEASNLFEDVFLSVAEAYSEDESDRSEPEPIRPYVDACGMAFQNDLEAWLKDDIDSPSNWLQSTRDLFCFHFMQYYIQLAINLRREFQQLADDPDDRYEPSIVDTHFGLWDERATSDRQFADEWRERSGVGIERDIYDSWGRLAALNVISETVQNAPGSDVQTPLSLSEALDLPPKLQEQCVEALESNYIESDRRPESDLTDAAQRLALAVRHDYEERSRANQTPITMGINVVRQLGDGNDRKFWRTQQRVGPTLRLNRSALRFMARLFTHAQDDVHYDAFVGYLERRGVFLDSKSQNVALNELEEMGMIDRQSDSGGAVYVRSL